MDYRSNATILEFHSPAPQQPEGVYHQLESLNNARVAMQLALCAPLIQPAHVIRMLIPQIDESAYNAKERIVIPHRVHRCTASVQMTTVYQ